MYPNVTILLREGEVKQYQFIKNVPIQRDNRKITRTIQERLRNGQPLFPEYLG
jgi:hypothetical protein